MLTDSSYIDRIFKSPDRQVGRVPGRKQARRLVAQRPDILHTFAIFRLYLPAMRVAVWRFRVLVIRILIAYETC